MLRHTVVLVAIVTAGILTGCGGGNSGGNQKSLSERQAIAMKLSNPDTRANELVKLSEDQFKAGEHAGARSSLTQAQLAVGEIEDNGARATTGIAIAAALAKHDMQMEAKSLLKDVRAAIDSDPNPATRASSLGRLALVYGASLDNETAAETYLADAASIIDEIPTTIDRVNALIEIGSGYQQIGRDEAAEAQFTTAIHLASQAETPREQADLLSSIANRLQALDLEARAQQVREQAKGIAEAVADDFSRGYALVNVAASYKQAGDSSTSASLLAAAEKAADKVADQGLKGELMSAIRRGS